MLAAGNVTVDCHVMDLSLHENITRLASLCADVDILVNNAGAIPSGNIDAVTGAKAGS